MNRKAAANRDQSVAVWMVRGSGSICWARTFTAVFFAARERPSAHGVVLNKIGRDGRGRDKPDSDVIGPPFDGALRIGRNRIAPCVAAALEF